MSEIDNNNAAVYFREEKVRGSGQPVVDRLWFLERTQRINFSGLLIPWTWLRKLLTKQARTYWIAIAVLNDIVFHYRAQAQWDDKIKAKVLKKRFRYRLYHLNREQIARKLGVEADTITAALNYLERDKELRNLLGDRQLIKRHHDRKINGRIFQQNIFIELNLAALCALCHDELVNGDAQDAEDAPHHHEEEMADPVETDSCPMTKLGRNRQAEPEAMGRLADRKPEPGRQKPGSTKRSRERNQKQQQLQQRRLRRRPEVVVVVFAFAQRGLPPPAPPPPL